MELLRSAPVADLAARYRYVPYEQIAAASIRKVTPARVDLMRELRATEARRHVREEVPFFTGPRTTLTAWADRQPLA